MTVTLERAGATPPFAYSCDCCRASEPGDSPPDGWAILLHPGGPHHFCASCRTEINLPAGVTEEPLAGIGR